MNDELGGQNLLGRADRDDPPLLHDHQLIGVSRGLSHIMQPDHIAPALLREPPHMPKNLYLVLGVEQMAGIFYRRLP